MRNINSLPGQTFFDIAVQELGDASRAMELAVLNAMSLTDELSPAQVIVVPDAAKEKKSTVTLFTNKALAPASNDSAGSVVTKNDGIDFWTIDKDFEVQ